MINKNIKGGNEMIKIIIVGDETYFGNIVEQDNEIILTEANELDTGIIEKDIKQWFYMKNKNELKSIKFVGLVSYSVRELTTLELDKFNEIQQKFDWCEKNAMGILINSTFDKLFCK
jgi:hypothetical protein